MPNNQLKSYRATINQSQHIEKSFLSLKLLPFLRTINQSKRIEKPFLSLELLPFLRIINQSKRIEKLFLRLELLRISIVIYRTLTFHFRANSHHYAFFINLIYRIQRPATTDGKAFSEAGRCCICWVQPFLLFIIILLFWIVDKIIRFLMFYNFTFSVHHLCNI